MDDRTRYPLRLKINGRDLNEVVIDQHYKEGHEDVNDEIILELLRELDGGTFLIEQEKGGFQYFRVEPVFFKKAPYRLYSYSVSQKITLA